MVLFYSFLIIPFLTFIRGFVIKSPIFISSKTKPLLIASNIIDFQGYPTSYQVQKTKTPNSEVAILFIHGFASSSYHWRYNLPAFSENYDTYAIDLIGFGNSSKPTILNYTIALWSEQVTEFIDRIIKKPCILVGNSLGAYISIYAATSSPSLNQKIKGVILINPVIISRSKPNIRVPKIFTKSIIKGYFQIMKRRQSIHYFFRLLYPIFPERIDDLIIDSIENPSNNINASDVFYGIVKENIINPIVFIEDIVENLDPKIPILLIYGTRDPWISRQSMDYFLELRPNTQINNVPAGHCPQDEIPEIVNPIIESFMTNLESK